MARKRKKKKKKPATPPAWWTEIDAGDLAAELGGAAEEKLRKAQLAQSLGMPEFKEFVRDAGVPEMSELALAITGLEREAEFQQRTALFRDVEAMQQMPFSELRSQAKEVLGVTARSRKDLISRVQRALPPSTAGMSVSGTGDISQVLSNLTWQEIVSLKPHLSEGAWQAAMRLTARRQDVYASAQRLYGFSASVVEGVLSPEDWRRISTLSEAEWKGGGLSSERSNVVLNVIGRRFKQLGGVVVAEPGKPVEAFAPRTRRELEAQRGGAVTGRIQYPAGIHAMSVGQAKIEISGTSDVTQMTESMFQRGEKLAADISTLKEVPGYGFVTNPETGEEMMLVPQFKKGVKRLSGMLRTGIIRAANLPIVRSRVVGQEGGAPELVQIVRHRFLFGPELVSGAGYYNPDVLGRFQREIVRKFRIPTGAKPLVSVGDVLSGSEPIKLFEGHTGINLRTEGLQDITVTGISTRTGKEGKYAELIFQGVGTLPEGVPVGSKYGGHKEGAYTAPGMLPEDIGIVARINEPYQAAASVLMALERVNPDLAAEIFGPDVLLDKDESGNIRWRPEYGPKFVRWLRKPGVLQSGYMPERAYNINDPVIAQAVEQGIIKQVTQPNEEGVFTGQEWNTWVDIEAAMMLQGQPAYNPNKQLGPEAIVNIASTDPKLAARLIRGTDRTPAVSMLGAMLATLPDEELGTPEARAIAESFRQRAVVVGPAEEGETRPVVDVQEVTQRAEATLREQGVAEEDIERLLPEQMLKTIGEMYPGKGIYLSEHGIYAPGGKEALAYGFQNIEGELTLVPRQLQQLIALEGKRQLGIGVTKSAQAEVVTGDILEAAATGSVSTEEMIEAVPGGLVEPEMDMGTGAGGAPPELGMEDLSDEDVRRLAADKLFTQILEATSSKDFMKALLGASSKGTGGGGWVSPVEGLPLNRFMAGHDVLRAMVEPLMLGGKTRSPLRTAWRRIAGVQEGKEEGRPTPEEVEALVGRIMAGDEELRASIWRDPSLTKEQRRLVMSYMGPEEAVRLGIVRDEKEYEKRFGSTVGVAPATMAAGAGDWDLDVMTRRARTFWRRTTGGWRARHTAAVSSVESIRRWLSEEPGGEYRGLLADLAEFGKGSLKPVREKLKAWSRGETIGTRTMALWTQAREAVRGKVMGGVFNLMQRQIGAELEGRHPALEAAQNLLATGYQLALDYKLKRVGPLKDEPDELESVRQPILEVMHLAGLKGTTFAWAEQNAETGETEFKRLRGREREYVERAVRALAGMRTTGGELGSAEARAALLISPERAPEEYERVRSILERIGEGPFGEDLTPQQLKTREDALREITNIVMPEQTSTQLLKPGRLTALSERTTAIRAMLAGSYYAAIRRAQQANIAAGRPENYGFSVAPGGGLYVPNFAGEGSEYRQYLLTPEQVEMARLGQRRYEFTGIMGRVQRWVQGGVVDAGTVLPRVVSAVSKLVSSGEAPGPVRAIWQQVMGIATGERKERQPREEAPIVNMRERAAELAEKSGIPLPVGELGDDPWYYMVSKLRYEVEKGRPPKPIKPQPELGSGLDVMAMGLPQEQKPVVEQAPQPVAEQPPRKPGKQWSDSDKEKYDELLSRGWSEEEARGFVEEKRQVEGMWETLSAEYEAERKPKIEQVAPAGGPPREEQGATAAAARWSEEDKKKYDRLLTWGWSEENAAKFVNEGRQIDRIMSDRIAEYEAKQKAAGAPPQGPPGRPSGIIPTGAPVPAGVPTDPEELYKYGKTQMALGAAMVTSAMAQGVGSPEAIGVTLTQVVGEPARIYEKMPKAPITLEAIKTNQAFLSGQIVFETQPKPFQEMTEAEQYEALTALGITDEQAMAAGFRIGAGKKPTARQWAALAPYIGNQVVDLERQLEAAGVFAERERPPSGAPVARGVGAEPGMTPDEIRMRGQLIKRLLSTRVSSAREATEFKQRMLEAGLPATALEGIATIAQGGQITDAQARAIEKASGYSVPAGELVGRPTPRAVSEAAPDSAPEELRMRERLVRRLLGRRVGDEGELGRFKQQMAATGLSSSALEGIAAIAQGEKITVAQARAIHKASGYGVAVGELSEYIETPERPVPEGAPVSAVTSDELQMRGQLVRRLLSKRVSSPEEAARFKQQMLRAGLPTSALEGISAIAQGGGITERQATAIERASGYGVTREELSEHIREPGKGLRESSKDLADAFTSLKSSLEDSNKYLQKFGNTLKQQVEEYEKGKRKADQAFVGFVNKMGAKAQEVLGAAQLAERAGIELTPEQRQAVEQWRSVAGTVSVAGRRMELERVEALAGGGGDRAGKTVFQRLKSAAIGWAPMQMGRAWGMLGAPVFHQMIPAAAEAEMQGWRLASAAGGYQGGPVLPEGVAGGVIRYRAMQQQAMIEAGRTGYRAWGTGLPATVAGGMKQAQALLGPAAGAGLVTGIGLNALGFTAAAGPAGAAVAGVLAAYGLSRYFASFGDETVENRQALYNATQSGSPVGAWWARVRASTGKRIQQASSLDYWLHPYQRVDPAVWEQQQEEQAARERRTPMREMTLSERAAMLNEWAKVAGPELGMREGQFLKFAQQFAGYEFMGRDVGSLTENMPKQLKYAAVTGSTPRQFANLAAQLRMGSGGYRTLFDWMMERGFGTPEQEDAVARLGQYSPLIGFGWDESQLRSLIDRGRLQEVTGYRSVVQQKLFAGDRYEWSRLALSGGAIPGLGATLQPGSMQFVTVDPRTGMPIGTASGGGVLYQAQRQVFQDLGVQAQLTQSGFGATTQLFGGQVNLNQWDIQRATTLRQRQEAETQYGRRIEQMGMQWTQQHAQWGLQDQSFALSVAHQRAMFGFQWEQLGMQDRRFYENLGKQWGRTQVQFGWGEEDRQRQFARQMVGFQWAREDLAFSAEGATLQQAWGLEDVEEQLRYATGRQRRALMRQRDRMTIQYARQMGRFETQGERIDQREEWAREDLNRDRERHRLRLQWAKEDIEQSRRYHEEDMDLAKRRLRENQRYFEDNTKLQEKQRDLARKYWEEMHEFQLKAIEMQRDYRKEMEAAQDALLAVSRSATKQMNGFFIRMRNYLAGLRPGVASPLNLSSPYD